MIIGETVSLDLVCQKCGETSNINIKWTGKNFKILEKQPNDLKKTLLEVFKKYNLLPE